MIAPSVAVGPIGRVPHAKVRARSEPVSPNSLSASSFGIGRTVPSGSSCAPRWPSRRYASTSASTFDCDGSPPPAAGAAGRSSPSSKPRKNWFHDSGTDAGSRFHAPCIWSMYSGLHAFTARPVEASGSWWLGPCPAASGMEGAPRSRPARHRARPKVRRL